jgi:hypothetical protein
MINTYDIESYEKDSTVVPYCICFSLNNKIHFFYVEKNKNIVIESLNCIVNENNEKYIEIFIHNLNFDGMLIINEISKSKIQYNIMAVKTSIYFLEIFYMGKVVKFRCSYKILPLSLRSIGEIENYNKKFFPYKFVNENTVNYVGEIPNSTY